MRLYMNKRFSIKKALSLLVVLCTLALSFTACSQRDEGPKTIDIATSVMTVQFPAEYKDNLQRVRDRVENLDAQINRKDEYIDRVAKKAGI